MTLKKLNELIKTKNRVYLVLYSQNKKDPDALKGFKNADVFVPQYSFHLGKHIIMKTVSRGFEIIKKSWGSLVKS